MLADGLTKPHPRPALARHGHRLHGTAGRHFTHDSGELHLPPLVSSNPAADARAGFHDIDFLPDSPVDINPNCGTISLLALSASNPAPFTRAAFISVDFAESDCDSD